MALTLYGIAQSRAFRTLWMLEELGLPYEQVAVGFENRRIVDPRLHAVNPNRKVPVLEDDGITLFESLAINLYLAEKHGGPLKWAGLIEAGHCYQWTLWAATEIEPPSQAWGLPGSSPPSRAIRRRSRPPPLRCTVRCRCWTAR